MSIKKEMNGLAKSRFFFCSPQHTFLGLMITICDVALILEPMARNMLGHLFPTFYPFSLSFGLWWGWFNIPWEEQMINACMGVFCDNCYLEIVFKSIYN